MTYADITDEANAKIIHDACESLWTSGRYIHQKEKPRFLVLDLKGEMNGVVVVGYYIVDLQYQMIGWGEHVSVDKITVKHGNVQCTRHLSKCPSHVSRVSIFIEMAP